MDKKNAGIIINKCMAVKEGENVLIVTDDVLYPLARKFYDATKEMGIESVLMAMTARDISGREPPRPIAGAMRDADVSILITYRSLSHTLARKDACRKFGARIASMPGVSEAVFDRSIDINYEKMAGAINRISDKLEKSSTLRVKTAKGTDLTMSIRGRKAFRDTGLYTKKGNFGNLPAGETAMAPVEGTANGVVCVDASAPFVGKFKKPVMLEVKNGYIKNMPVPEIHKRIKRLGKKAYNVAELGLGFNPKARITGNILEDEKVINTAHMAIGNNESFGGNVYCQCHLDFVFKAPVIYLDGEELKY